MALPDLDAKGNLPPGRHDASVEEVRAAFVDPFDQSHSRRAIFDWWTELRDALTELGAYEARWLAGSFVSDKPQPNDIDLITVLDGPAYDEMPRHKRKLIQAMVAGNVTEQLWRCDKFAEPGSTKHVHDRLRRTLDRAAVAVPRGIGGSCARTGGDRPVGRALRDRP